MNNFLKQAHEKYRQGDSITDDELKALRNHYKKLDETLRECWIEKYALFANDVYSNLVSLESYMKARKEKST